MSDSQEWSTGSDDAVAAYRDELREVATTHETAASPATILEPPRARLDPYNAYTTPLTISTADDGALAECRVGVKDNIAIAGVPLTAGVDTTGVEASTDATVTRRLRTSGATITGTTRMDALALGTTGELGCTDTPVNPRASDYIPGGSSSGSAVAVGSELVDAALGTDTGGSVRIPATCCGVVGFKPTYGRIPRYGVVPLSPSNDHVGILGLNVDIVATVFDAIRGPDPADLASRAAADPPRQPPEETSLTVGVLAEAFERTDDAVERIVRNAIGDVVDAQGWHLETVSCPLLADASFINDVQTLVELATVLQCEGPLTGIAHHSAVTAFLDKLEPDGVAGPVGDSIAIGEALRGTDEVVATVWDVRRQLCEQIRAALQGAGIDVLGSPTLPCFPPRRDTIDTPDGLRRLLANTCPFNLTGHPSLSIPIATDRDVPVGLQLTTRRNADTALLAIGRTVSQTVSSPTLPQINP